MAWSCQGGEQLLHLERCGLLGFVALALKGPPVKQLAGDMPGYYAWVAACAHLPLKSWCRGVLSNACFRRVFPCATPAEVRSQLPPDTDVVAFQCRNPVHRAHYELFTRALHAPNVRPGAVCLVHPTCGPTQVCSHVSQHAAQQQLVSCCACMRSPAGLLSLVSLSLSTLLASTIAGTCLLHLQFLTTQMKGCV